MKGHYSPLEEAKHAVVHEYRGGAVALASRLGMNPGTLSNKVNPDVHTHHLTVDEAVAIQNVARDTRIIAAEAAALDGVFVPLKRPEHVADVHLLEAYANYHAEIGQTAQALKDALADGRIERREYQRIHAEAFEDAAAMFSLLHRLEALVQD